MPGQGLSERLRTAARVRAAIAYSGLRSDDLAARLSDECSLATLRRITSHTRPRGASLAELWHIADVCQVPRSWLERGIWIEGETAEIAGPAKGVVLEGDIDQRFDTVARYLDLIVERLELHSGTSPDRDVKPSPN